MFAERLVHLQVADTRGTRVLAIVKRGLSLTGSVNELIQEDNVAGMDVFAERAACCGDYDMGATFFLQGMDVGTVVDVRWHKVVLFSMPALCIKNMYL